MLSKADLRSQMRSRLRNLGDVRTGMSLLLSEALIQRPEYERAETVAIFDPLPSEPDISLLWHMAPRQFLYPRIVEDKLQLLRADNKDDLEQAAPGLPFREPPFSAERVINLAKVDLILVPGLAFSFDGKRLGRGGGYYDRLLATLPPRTMKIGVCFNFQLLPDLPTERHDERVNTVITD